MQSRVCGARHGGQCWLAPVSDGSLGGGRSALGCSARSGSAHCHSHPLSISRRITSADVVQVTTNVQAGKQGLVPLMNSSQTISWPRAMTEVHILASRWVLHPPSLPESLLQTPRSACSSSGSCPAEGSGAGLRGSQKGKGSFSKAIAVRTVLQLLFIAIALRD